MPVRHLRTCLKGTLHRRTVRRTMYFNGINNEMSAQKDQALYVVFYLWNVENILYFRSKVCMKYGKTYMYGQTFYKFTTSSCESPIESDAINFNQVVCFLINLSRISIPSVSSHLFKTYNFIRPLHVASLLFKGWVSLLTKCKNRNHVYFSF